MPSEEYTAHDIEQSHSQPESMISVILQYRPGSHETAPGPEGRVLHWFTAQGTNEDSIELPAPERNKGEYRQPI
jgi:hypothetical protein